MKVGWILTPGTVDAYYCIELIITCSTLPEKGLFDDLILTPAAQPTLPNQSAANIHVQSDDGRVWLVERMDCSTYFVSTGINREQEKAMLINISLRTLQHISQISRVDFAKILISIWKKTEFMRTTGTR